MARRPQAVFLFVAAAAAAVLATSVVVSASSEESSQPTILTPVADTPLGSFEGADGPVADDAMDDEDAAPVGSPIGTTMTEPMPFSKAPPGVAEGDDADITSAAAAAPSTVVIAAALVAAMATAGVFGF